MELSVLVKVVPDHEAMGYDALGLRAVREGVPLFMNPFDQRALRVALDLRRPGDRVSVASMGPAAVAPVLAEAYALGADRVSLVSDPALAGSDTLVTARVLTRLLGRSTSDVVLLGARTTDGETGQVPAEIAALRNVPLASSARSVAWELGSSGLLVTSDTEEGWAAWRVPTPCVVSVGEKVAKIRHPTDEDHRKASGRSVEIVTLADLGIPAGIVGVAGSPTRVVAVRPASTGRAGVVLSEGPIAERIARAVELLSSARTSGPTRPVLTSAPGPSPRSGRRSIVLVSGPEGALEDRALALLSESRRALGLAPSAVWVGPSTTPEVRATLRRAGASDLFEINVPSEPLEGRTVALGLERILLGRPHYEAGIFLSSHFGREVAGRVAARLGLGLTGDAVEVRRDAQGAIVWSKPAFGGNAVADVVSRTSPSLATVRPGVFELLEGPSGPDLLVQRIEPPAEPRELSPIGRGPEPLEGYGDLDLAPVAVAVGVGVGGPEGIERIRRLIGGTGWALAATRRVVDAGWVPRRLQVGLTGRSSAPDLVLLVGIRGAPNHLVGWKRARRILAINLDPASPVFAGSDVGIVATWEEALPGLVEALRPRFRGPADRVSGPAS